MKYPAHVYYLIAVSSYSFLHNLSYALFVCIIYLCNSFMWCTKSNHNVFGCKVNIFVFV